MTTTEYELKWLLKQEDYANGADGRKCFDILRDSVVYDFGIVGGGNAASYWRPCFYSSGLSWNNSFATNYKSDASARAEQFQKVLDDYAKYVNN